MRVRRLVLCAVLAAFAAGMFSAAALAPDGVDSITVAVSDNIPNTIDRVMYRALSGLGYGVKLRSYTMMSAAATVNGGESDVLAFQTPSAVEGYGDLIQVPESIITRGYYVYTRSGGSGTINYWEDFSGKSIGIAYRRFYLESKLPADVKKITRLPTEPMIFSGLLRGDFDYVIISRFGDEEINAPHGVRLASVIDRQDAYAYVNKKNEWLVPLLTEQFREMKADGTMEKILSRGEKGDNNGRADVLYISSYSAEMEMEKAFREGFMNVVGDRGINLFSYDLDAKRYQNDEQRNHNIINIIRSDFIDRNPDAIIVSGDDAFEFLRLYYDQFFRGVPVVISGVSGFAESHFGKYADYFAGTTQKIFAAETVELILELFPKTTQIYVINGYNGTDKIWRDEIAAQLRKYSGTIDVVFSPDVAMQELLTELKELPSSAVVLNGVYYTDSSGKYYTHSESNKLFNDNVQVPSFGLIGVSVGYGQIGGKCINTYNQGKFTGEELVRVLNGEDIRGMQILTEAEDLNNWLFDADALRRWNIIEASLPPESAVINKKQSMLQTNPTEFALLMALIFGALVAIAALLNMTNELSKKNKQLHTTEEILAKDEEIKELSNRSRLIISSAPLGFLLTKDDVITEINSYAEKIFGLQAGDRYLCAFADESAHDGIVEALNDFGYFQSEVNTLVTANGELNRFFTSGTTIDGRDGTCHANWVMDIENLERKKDEIKRAQEDFERVIFGMPSPVILIDTESVEIIYCNQFFIDIFGFKDLEHAVGFSYYDLFPQKQPDGTPSREIVDKSVEFFGGSSEFVTSDRVYKLLNGKLIDAQTSVGTIVYNERKAIIIILRDVTAEKEQQRMLESIAEREKESNMMKSRFLVNMSHEIRTPMNAIIGLSELGLRKTCDAEAAETLGKINNSAKILLTIINDILDFSKIEAEKLDFINEEFELEEVLENALMVSQQRIGDKPVEMLLSVSPDVPYRVIGDKTRVWQVLKNFLDNSAKFTNSGRIVCEVRLYQHEPRRAWLGFAVTDTGTGVSEANLKKIFMPFEQFGDSSQSKCAGTGLGMPIAKQLIELMGGNIEIHSKEGEGTCVDFVIPFALPKKQATFKETYEKNAMEGVNVLIAGNDDDALGVMEELLDIVEIRHKSASDGEEAVKLNEAANKNEEPFDLIILNYRMEGMDGIRTAKKLRPSMKKDAKILQVTACSRQLAGDMPEIVDGVIEKPFTPNSFYKMVMSAMGLKLDEEKADYTESITFKNSRVLLCEDNVINQEVALGMLEEFGIKAVVAENGRQALAILEKQEFDLVLMDILMPVMDGHEATAKIRASGKPYKDIPIVAMTANVMQEEIKKCMDEGMNGHISKPIDFQKLQAKLIRWLPGEQMEIKDKTGAGSLPKVKGLDTAQGLAHFEGKKEDYIAAVKLFLEQHHKKQISFENAVAESNIKNLSSNIHDIIGASAHIGATKINKAARRFDTQLKMNMPDILQYEKLNEYIAELRESVVNMLEENYK